MAVLTYHCGLWVHPIVRLFGLTLFMDSREVSSAGSKRPYAVFYQDDALCGKLVAKASDADIGKAADELLENLGAEVGQFFPARQDAIPGFAVARNRVRIYAISRKPEALLLRQFTLASREDRRDFLGVALRVGRWIAAADGPSARFHLPHSAAVTTSGLRKTHRAEIAHVELITLSGGSTTRPTPATSSAGRSSPIASC